MDTRAVHKHLKKQGWSLTRSSGGHDVFTHPDAKHHIPVPRHRQLKAPLVRGILKQSQVNEQLEEEKKANTSSVRAGLSKRPVKPLTGKDAEKKKKESDAAWERLMSYANSMKKEEIEKLDEGRPSQRHPLEGHEYHRKTNAELEYIAKDAHKAAEAMKSHNTDAENKYRDQASDSATVRYFRQKNGMPNWYKKKYGHVNEETSKHAGWIAHYNGQKHEIPKEHAKDLYDAKQKAIAHFKAPKSKHSLIAIKPAYNEEVVVEDNVINTNSPNSVLNNPATQQATTTNITKKKQVIDRYTTGKSSAVSGTTVVASPRESVEIQEGRMKDMAGDTDFHPTVTKSKPPFDGPYKTKPKNVTDKSGAVHTPMSRVKDLARRAARKNGGLKEDNENTLSSYDKEDTPAKKTLSKTAGMVKDLADKAKTKAKGKKSDDTFQPEPELASNIVR
jgi:predicted RNA binding protein YcfA (HicA-like mRNA interferase family)